MADISVGQVWVSPDTGNRWRVDALVLGHAEGTGKVRVMRLPDKGRDRLPKWDDGVYVFHPASFVLMRLEGSPRVKRCPNCQDRPGLDGLGRTCKTCGGSGDVADGVY
jgi:hypothetical protein